MDDNVQVELELDNTPTDGTTVAVEAPEQAAAAVEQREDPIVALKDEFEKLKAQDESRAKAIDEANRRAAEDRARADKAAREAAEARTQIADTSFHSVESAITATESEIAVAKKEYAQALESGDYTKAADAQEKISTAAAKKTALESRKGELDVQRKRQTVVVEQSAYDPLAALSAPSREWVLAHPECMTNPQKQQQMIQAHSMAVSPSVGLKPDTPEYFGFIERCLGYEQKPQQQEQQTQSRSRQMPSAPPSREPAAAPTGKVSVNLTGSEVKAATDGTIVWNTGKDKGKPIGVQEMARRKALLEKDGKYRNININ